MGSVLAIRCPLERPVEVEQDSPRRILTDNQPYVPMLVFMEMQRTQASLHEQTSTLQLKIDQFDGEKKQCIQVFQEYNSALQKKIDKLEEENKAQGVLLNSAHDYLIAKDIRCIFQALDTYPGLAKAVLTKLEGKHKNPLSIIRAVEFTVNEDQISALFADECADPNEKILKGFCWVRAEPRKDVLEALANYNKTLKILGETLTPQLAPDETENLLNDLFKMIADPAEAEAAKKKIEAIQENSAGSVVKDILIALVKYSPTILQTAAAFGTFGELFVAYKAFVAAKSAINAFQNVFSFIP